MPTYQYACTACEHRLEAVQAFTDDALTVCPECGGKLRKLFGSVGVVFKGSGFYRTDSRNGKVAAETSSDAKSDSKSESKSETKTESKKTETKATASSDSSSSSTTSTPAKAAAAS